MTDWTRACATAELLPGESKVVWLDDVAVLLCNYDGDVYALEDKCSHEDFELSAGAFDAEEATIECVLHGAKFDVRNGRPLCPPAYVPVATFPARIEGDGVWVRLG